MTFFRVGQAAMKLAFCLALFELQGCAHTAAPIERAMNEYPREVKRLPAKIEAETVRLDGAGLQAGWLLDMLAERNVSMIEISPRAIPDDSQVSLLAPGSYGTNAWTLPVATFKLVQLRLSQDGDPSCVRDEDLHYDLSHRLRREPLRRDTCLSMKIASVSEARYHLRHVAEHPFGPPFGRWEVFDTAQHVVVASLTTVDSADRPSRTSRFEPSANAPYVTLALLFDNTDAHRSPPFRTYLRRDVMGSRPPPREDTDQGPVVSGSWSFRSYPDADFNALFNKTWQRAVEEAERTGWGYAQQTLLDGRKGTRSRLYFPGQTVYHTVTALDRGFYVTPGNWAQSGRVWLSRYGADGVHQWTVTIHADGVPATVTSDCVLAAIEQTHDAITLTKSCRKDLSGATGNTGLVGRIEINKKDLEAALRKQAENAR